MRRPQAEKIRQIALCLPLFGLFLLLPPAVRIFAVPVAVMGVPLIVVYVFGLWAILIIGTAALTRYLGKMGQVGDSVPDQLGVGQDPPG